MQSINLVLMSNCYLGPVSRQYKQYSILACKYEFLVYLLALYGNTYVFLMQSLTQARTPTYFNAEFNTGQNVCIFNAGQNTYVCLMESLMQATTLRFLMESLTQARTPMYL